MSFVQIIEYETDRFEDMRALGKEQMAQLPAARDGFRVVVTQDRERPHRFLTIVEFPSYEAAMANSARPETADFARKMAELCTSEPRYYNLDVQYTMP
jgi:quinol monooxygenase YgiN